MAEFRQHQSVYVRWGSEWKTGTYVGIMTKTTNINGKKVKSTIGHYVTVVIAGRSAPQKVAVGLRDVRAV
ncbi:hypothetical protein GLOTRDRAFT_130117 [Gloeophyllum trabeum ATCC 11539]|uniref:Uncharacterized protein n=1 Tax=Gloeophyllum trabeum (strain ATCC 11539 / FP-39264 / Madison 617) TaxID=670483 RepID=S7Q5K2_GLOTA|nr:uncharacterized protein GLOTRDRAFT_130117 [Gloeophyllum trabeum ATCC 11539]EPQ54763.1 hypothetical protein GLOTRDRAFT_130117 [Gloeophyllum trabeum ATCC 11539]